MQRGRRRHRLDAPQHIPPPIAVPFHNRDAFFQAMHLAQFIMHGRMAPFRLPNRQKVWDGARCVQLVQIHHTLENRAERTGTARNLVRVPAHEIHRKTITFLKMSHFIIIAAAGQAFDIGGLNLGRIRVCFMRALQRLIRKAPVAITRHAGQEKIGLPFTGVFRQNAINHRARFFALSKAEQHAGMHHIKAAITDMEFARPRHHGNCPGDIALVNQQAHQIIQRIAILGLKFEGFFKPRARRRNITKRAPHARQQPPYLAIARIKPHAFLKSLSRRSVVPARFFNIAQILPGRSAFRIKLLGGLQHGRSLIQSPGALQHDPKKIGQREILGLARMHRRHKLSRFLVPAKIG